MVAFKKKTGDPLYKAIAGMKQLLLFFMAFNMGSHYVKNPAVKLTLSKIRLVPDLKRVERSQRVVVLSGCHTGRRSRCPGLKPRAAGIGGTCRAAQAIRNDREWALVAPFMPPPNRIGRPRTVDLREVMNATPYIATTGCQRAMLPKDFPPCSTV